MSNFEIDDRYEHFLHFNGTLKREVETTNSSELFLIDLSTLFYSPLYFYINVGRAHLKYK